MNFILFLIFSFFCQNIYAIDDIPESCKRGLSIDGGGIRGIYPAQVLAHMERDLKERGIIEKNICDFFKGGLSGTSTGALIVLALATKYHKFLDSMSSNIPQPMQREGVPENGNYSSLVYTSVVSTSSSIPDMNPNFEVEEEKSSRTPQQRDGGLSETVQNSENAPEGFIEGPYSPKEIVDFYKEMSQKVFKNWTCHNCYENATECEGSWLNQCFDTLRIALTCAGCCACYANCNGYCGPKYSNHNFKELLKEYFGDLTLKDTIVPVQIVSYDLLLGKPVYFTSTDHPDMKMVDAALASAAAPTYFSAHQFEYIENSRLYQCIDGGVFENSSSFSAARFGMKNLNELQKKINPANINESIFSDFKVSRDSMTIVSIGTGFLLKGDTTTFRRLKRAGKLGWIGDLIQISLSANTQALVDNLNQMDSIVNEYDILSKTQFFRINALLSESESAMDDPMLLARISAKADDLTENADYKKFLLYLNNFKQEVEELNTEKTKLYFKN